MDGNDEFDTGDIPGVQPDPVLNSSSSEEGSEHSQQWPCHGLLAIACNAGAPPDFLNFGWQDSVGIVLCFPLFVSLRERLIFSSPFMNKFWEGPEGLEHSGELYAPGRLKVLV